MLVYFECHRRAGRAWNRYKVRSWYLFSVIVLYRWYELVDPV